MAWLEENETKGQEQYRMDRVPTHRKVDTNPVAGVPFGDPRVESAADAGDEQFGEE